MPQAGNNSPLVRAKSCSGSNFFYRPPAGWGGAKGTVFGVCKVFFSSATRSKLVSSSQLGNILFRGFRAGSGRGKAGQRFSCPILIPILIPRPGQGRGSELGLPGAAPAAQWDKASPPFAAAEDAPSSSTLEGDAKEKMLSPVKWVFLLSLRPCRGDAEEPHQKPSLYGQGIRPQLCYPDILTGFL